MEENPKRRHSADDLNVELKSAANQTVEVFVAYARESSVRLRDQSTCESEVCALGGPCPFSQRRRPCDLGIAVVDATIPEAPSPPLISPTSVVDSALQAAGVCSKPRSLSTSEVTEACAVGTVEAVKCARRVDSDAQAVARRLIAIGDSLDASFGDNLLEAADAGVPLQEVVGPFLRELTWENVVKLFRTAYRLIEQYNKSADDGRWAAFDELWVAILTHVSRWILQRGGWSTLLSVTSQGPHDSPTASPTINRSRIYSISESGMMESEEMVSLSQQSLELSPGNNLLDSGLSLQDSSCSVHDTTGHNEDLDTTDHFLRHRSRSLPPNRRGRRRSLRQSLDSIFVFRSALMVWNAVVGILHK